MRAFVISAAITAVLLAGCGDNTTTTADIDVHDSISSDSVSFDSQTADDGSVQDGFDSVSDDNSPDADDSDIAADAMPDITDAGDIEPGLDDPPYARFINPFIGTQDGLFNVGNTFPGPGLPFGMVRLSPDTGDTFGAAVYSHCGGYRWADPLIYGFSHNHLHGTGAPDYGDFLAMPVTEVSTARTKVTTFASEYDKASESAEAGYYSVTLQEPAIKVELTATTRCGIHRYTFPEGTETGAIAIDYSSSIVDNRSLGGFARLAQDGIVEVLNHHLGTFAARFDGYDVYAAIRFSHPPSGFGTWKDDQLNTESAEITIPRDTEASSEFSWGGYFEFDIPENGIIEMQVCLSYASVDGARANMAAELDGRDFDTVRQAAFDAWEEFVGDFRTIGGDLDRKTNYYTALYHVAQMPQIWNDVDGWYQGFDKANHQTDGWNYYTDLSLWDTFRTQQPLIALVWPQIHRDINRSMLEMARQSGNLPKWALAAGDTGSMIGQHAATIVADSYLKGITDFNVDETFDYLVACANDTLEPGAKGRRDSVPEYNSIGYVPAENSSSSVSVTLEYAFCDFCLAELARELERADEETVFRARSLNYKNVWDSELMFFREKNLDGTWTASPEDYDPTVMTFGGKNQGYTEGSGWQYRWFAPHDPEGLIELYGDEETFVTLLSEFFQVTKDNFNFQVPAGWYYHGNEPDIHAAFMFINGKRPDLSQYWARWILDTNYRNEPEGLVGNDDAGTLAAWYVWAASGLYPSPCLPGYFITSPAFDEVTIKLPGGDLIVRATGASGNAIYITGGTFNGEPIDMETMWLTHEQIKNGGLLELTVSDTPPAS